MAPLHIPRGRGLFERDRRGRASFSPVLSCPVGRGRRVGKGKAGGGRDGGMGRVVARRGGSAMGTGMWMGGVSYLHERRASHGFVEGQG